MLKMNNNIIQGCFMMGTALAGSWMASIIALIEGQLFISGFFASLLLMPSIIDIVETKARYHKTKQLRKIGGMHNE